MNAPYDQDDEGRWLPRRDWGAYLTLATGLFILGVVEAYVIATLFHLMVGAR